MFSNSLMSFSTHTACPLVLLTSAERGMGFSAGRVTVNRVLSAQCPQERPVHNRSRVSALALGGTGLFWAVPASASLGRLMIRKVTGPLRPTRAGPCHSNHNSNHRKTMKLAFSENPVESVALLFVQITYRERER